VSDKFQPGQIWEMRYDDDEPARPLIFMLIEKLPPQDNGRRFGVSHNTWDVLVLVSSPIHAQKPGRSRLQLDDVSFYHGEIGYDSYDNSYERLA